MMVSNTAQNSQAAQANSSTAPSSTSGSNLASEDTFLKLFVAQLQNQDPLSPNQQDPTQMVSELAQFSQLEQLVNIGQGVSSINSVLTGITPSSSGTSSDSNSNSTAGSQGA